MFFECFDPQNLIFALSILDMQTHWIYIEKVFLLMGGIFKMGFQGVSLEIVSNFGI